MSHFTNALDPELALDASIQAMADATARVNQTTDPVKAFIAIGESVWWITVVNDTLQTEPFYKDSLSDNTFLRDTLAGLRSVRNRIGHEVNLIDYVNLEATRSDQYGDGRVAAWSWKSVPPPKATQRRYAMENHRAYEVTLAGRTVVEGFSRTQMFLELVRGNRS